MDQPSAALVRSIQLDSVCAHLHDDRHMTPITADLRAGDIVWLRGDVGVGKTTLVRALLGLGDDLSGRLRVNGQEAATIAPSDVFYLPQVPSFLTGDVISNIVLNRPELGCEARAGLCALGKGALATQQIDPDDIGLSGGERRVVGWLRGLRHTSGVRVLDEPLNGLDQQTVQVILDQLESDRGNWITLVVSHDPRVSALSGVREIWVSAHRDARSRAEAAGSSAALSQPGQRLVDTSLATTVESPD